MRFVKGHHMRLAAYRANLRRPPWTDERRRRHAATKRANALGNTRTVRVSGVDYRMVMTETGYRYEHRLIVEALLGRQLARTEHIHHVNGDGLDNRPENLRVMDAVEHLRLHRYAAS
jgi:hypothetical protein